MIPILSPLPLYEFQQKDVDKLCQNAAGLDGSEMGTGKTLKGVAIDGKYRTASDSKCRDITLVIAPLNVGPVWTKWFKRQAPHLRVGRLNPKNRAAFLQSISNSELDVYVMHWDALRLMPELARLHFFHIIADEAHRASNRKAQQTQALKRLKTEHKTAMSGTLSGNKPAGLWSPLNWVYPRDWRSYWRFDKQFVVRSDPDPVHGYTKVIGVKNESMLQREIRPYYVRHLKKQKCCENHPLGVMPWLEDKYYETVWVELAPSQRKKYDQMRKNQLAWVGAHEDKPLTANIVMAQMTRLTQFAGADADIIPTKVNRKLKDASGDFTGEYEVVVEDRVRLQEPSSKLDVCMQFIMDNEDKQFVVWSGSKQMIDLLGARLEKAKVDHVLFTGATPATIRDTIEEDFASGRYRVFAGVIKAGGVGLTLTAASTEIFLDRSWDGVENQQAEDRLHRDGQKNAVQVIDIMAKNTTDLGRNQDLKRNWEWLKTLLGDNPPQELM